MKSSQDAFATAFAAHQRTQARHEAFLESDGMDAPAEEDIRRSVSPGLYEHWKSKEGDLKYYAVLGAGCERDVHKPLVALAALYAPHAGHLAFLDLLHPERGFLTPIKREAYVGPRFGLVARLSLAEIHTLLQYTHELSVIPHPTQFGVHCTKLLKRKIMII